jgi:Fe2+ or Zn2+ uptake regulation protein
MLWSVTAPDDMATGPSGPVRDDVALRAGAPAGDDVVRRKRGSVHGQSAIAGDEAALIDRLRARGQRVTSQRVVLYRVLQELARHATAEEVLRAAAPRLPQLSLPTVYATLDLFAELGLVRRLAPHAGAVLYDPGSHEHAHAVCRRCGKVTDLDAGLDPGPARAAARAAGFEPEGIDLAVYGVCADCSSRWTVSGENAGTQTAT